jgi:chromosome condensin MukBEF MukE localization factor
MATGKEFGHSGDRNTRRLDEKLRCDVIRLRRLESIKPIVNASTRITKIELVEARVRGQKRVAQGKSAQPWVARVADNSV